MKWNAQYKEKIAYILAVLSFGIGFGMTIAGFCVEPIGEVHGSILSMLGECLVFTAAVLGISLHIKNETSQMKAQLKESIDKKFIEMEQREDSQDNMEKTAQNL